MIQNIQDDIQDTPIEQPHTSYSQIVPFVEILFEALHISSTLIAEKDEAVELGGGVNFRLVMVESEIELRVGISISSANGSITLKPDHKIAIFRKRHVTIGEQILDMIFRRDEGAIEKVDAVAQAILFDEEDACPPVPFHLKCLGRNWVFTRSGKYVDIPDGDALIYILLNKPIYFTEKLTKYE